MSWYIQSQNSIEIKPPVDGAGHMTSDDPALIFEAFFNGQQAGYALVVFPKNKQYSYVGQVTVRPEFRLKGVATALYNNIDEYLAKNKMPHLRPSRDLTPGSQRIWDKRMANPRRASGWYDLAKTSAYDLENTVANRTPPEIQQKIVQMHDSGSDPITIGRALGLKPITVKAILRKHNRISPETMHGGHAQPSMDIQQKMIDDYKRGYGISAIAKKYKTYDSTVSSILRRNGIEIQGPKGPRMPRQPEPIQDFVIRLYNQYQDVKVVSNMTSLGEKTIEKILQVNNIPVLGGQHALV